MVGQPPRFVVGRPSPIEPVEAVCRYVGQELQPFLPRKFQQMFEQATADRLSESLCVLYVAITRAKHALHMLVAEKPAGSDKCARTFAGLLRAALCDNRPLPADKLAFEIGDASWYSKLSSPPVSHATPSTPPAPLTITLAPTNERRRRGWQAVSPSHLEGGGEQRVADIFRRERAAGQQFGTLAHTWLSKIHWLEEGVPDDATLRRIAIDEVGWQHELEGALRQFHSWLKLPELTRLLSLASYGLGTTARLPLTVHNEQAFAYREAGQLINGSIDRLVLHTDGDRVVAAEVIDYKTDALLPGKDTDFNAKIAYYRPQLDAYRRAVARLYRLPLESVSATLLFLANGTLVSV
jgi:ATP-dependent helicase/nuclease subunit A